MKEKINIAEILRDMPQGTKLYSPIFGDVELKTVRGDCEFPITVTTIESECLEKCFAENGLYYKEYTSAEPTLLPSSEMRDWSKFFKRGDAVFNDTFGAIAIFDSWANDDYTKFNTTIKYYYDDGMIANKRVCPTEKYSKVTDEQKADFITKIEKRCNGKYNPETLQIDSVKYPFKPFEKVIAKFDKDSEWRCEYFSHYNNSNSKSPYVCLASDYKYCIPYDGNEHFLGTTLPYTEGGEG